MAYDENRIRQKQAELEREGNFGDKAEFWKPKEGENTIRIVPAYGDREDFYMEYKVCWKVGPNKKKIIPRTANGLPGPDPLQEYTDELARKTDEASLKELQRISPKTEFAMFIIDRQDEAKGPQAWTPSITPFRDVLRIMADPDYKDITSVYPTADEEATGARDLKVTYTPGTKTKNGFAEYHIQARAKGTPLGTEEQIREWTGVDLFEKYRVGEPHEAAYVNAVLQGKEQEYINARKANRDDDVPFTVPPASPPPTYAPTAPPEKLEPQYVYPTGWEPTKKLWTLDSENKAVEITADVVMLRVRDGHDPTIHSGDNAAGWKKATEFGFKVVYPQPSPPAVVPASPPSSPPPPSAPSPPSAPVMSEEEALKKQLEELKAKQAAQNGTDAARELKEMLK